MNAADVTGQDWGLALLFSVEPSDRALAGWGSGQGGPRYLMILAETCERSPGAELGEVKISRPNR